MSKFSKFIGILTTTFGLMIFSGCISNQSDPIRPENRVFNYSEATQAERQIAFDAHYDSLSPDLQEVLDYLTREAKKNKTTAFDNRIALWERLSRVDGATFGDMVEEWTLYSIAPGADLTWPVSEIQDNMKSSQRKKK